MEKGGRRGSPPEPGGRGHIRRVPGSAQATVLELRAMFSCAPQAMCHGPRELLRQAGCDPRDELGVGLSRECLARLSLNGCGALEVTYSRPISSSRSEGYSKQLIYKS